MGPKGARAAAVGYSTRTASPTRMTPPLTMSARRPPRWTSPCFTFSSVRLVRWLQGSLKAHPAQADLADAELAAHQVVQRHAAGDDVAARLAGLDLHLVVAIQRLDRLQLDQRHLAAAAGRGG